MVPVAMSFPSIITAAIHYHVINYQLLTISLFGLTVDFSSTNVIVVYINNFLLLGDNKLGGTSIV